VLDGQKILITGATGKIAYPIARALAKRNEVWGSARFSKPADRDRLAAIGVTPLMLDMASGDFTGLPEDFTHVFHAAVDPGAGSWRSCVETNADHSGRLLYHCRRARGFVYCSTGSIYQYQGQRPLTEADGPGVPQRANYSFSKIAGEAVCTWVAQQFRIPLTIIRICSTYGPEGGAPADRLEMMLKGTPIPLHPDKPNNYNPIYEDGDGECGGLLHLHGRVGGRDADIRLHDGRAYPALARRHLHAQDSGPHACALARRTAPHDRASAP
jgi:nucleoside-diphosphate-sugar epimerase